MYFNLPVIKLYAVNWTYLIVCTCQFQYPLTVLCCFVIGVSVWCNAPNTRITSHWHRKRQDSSHTLTNDKTTQHRQRVTKLKHTHYEVSPIYCIKFYDRQIKIHKINNSIKLLQTSARSWIHTTLTYPIVNAEQPRTNIYSLMMDTCYPKHV
jgi:hypothetical protein